jgi:hypothetical protein
MQSAQCYAVLKLSKPRADSSRTHVCSQHEVSHADLFIRIHDSTHEREGIQAALEVMRMVMKPGVDAALEHGTLKPCHLTSGPPICSLTLAILKLVQVRPRVAHMTRRLRPLQKPKLLACVQPLRMRLVQVQQLHVNGDIRASLQPLFMCPCCWLHPRTGYQPRVCLLRS